MLVLSRKPGQRILINDDIEIVVIDMRGDRVRLGISAPADVPVHREEVYSRITSASPMTADVEMCCNEDYPRWAEQV